MPRNNRGAASFGSERSSRVLRHGRVAYRSVCCVLQVGENRAGKVSRPRPCLQPACKHRAEDAFGSVAAPRRRGLPHSTGAILQGPAAGPRRMAPLHVPQTTPLPIAQVEPASRDASILFNFPSGWNRGSWSAGWRIEPTTEHSHRFYRPARRTMAHPAEKLVAHEGLEPPPEDLILNQARLPFRQWARIWWGCSDLNREKPSF